MIQSTMQRLLAENERLRRTGKIDQVVYWACLIAIVGTAFYKIGKGLLW